MRDGRTTVLQPRESSCSLADFKMSTYRSEHGDRTTRGDSSGLVGVTSTVHRQSSNPAFSALLLHSTESCEKSIHTLSPFLTVDATVLVWPVRKPVKKGRPFGPFPHGKVRLRGSPNSGSSLGMLGIGSAGHMVPFLFLVLSLLSTTATAPTRLGPSRLDSWQKSAHSPPSGLVVAGG
ncbi:hypothetical protein VTO42DRAFT_1781 [Malbranchea cinnamomea]